MPYLWRSPAGDRVEMRICELARDQDLSYVSLKALASGRQGVHRGWTCLNPLRSRPRSRRGESKGGVTVHRWRNLREKLQDEGTVKEMARRYGLGEGSLYRLASGDMQEHRNWRHVALLARLPVRRFEVTRDNCLEPARLSAIELVREKGLTLEGVQRLLRGESVQGWTAVDPPSIPAGLPWESPMDGDSHGDPTLAGSDEEFSCAAAAE
jgi:hypothetical protein